ncbi:Piso0_004107 [Millerozyma farinosa CBS 7064]|uniref:Piso0_004107 protein n=1 Tax=Pichia sorbitophila (strain ATCC MYA-4447 / BCRC 22081 / CBS 7064 / NBRC 10061 / NRRL Y-12695) TaxID=559304 RepID=G8Y7I0_PICSO|nr:Piso0_004107 [Millerozyma farinosa CBS 7064]CCE84560.1 Piso0_004107 [Millerozyma farinosa CBS 7064]
MNLIPLWKQLAIIAHTSTSSLKMKSRYENGSSEQKNFFAKIKENYSSKFSNLSLSSPMQHISNFSEHDGNSDDDTLLHNAFVKYFDQKGEPYPDWLGVNSQNSSNVSKINQYQNSPYQPVYSNYNSNSTQPQHSASHVPRQNNTPNANEAPEEAYPQRPTYIPRKSSRLQDMYNRSRQQAIPGSGYNSQIHQPAPTRSNSSSTTGSRLRERMFNASANTYSNSGSPSNNESAGRATWGRH